MSAGEPNIHILDAAYKPFPPFAEWVSRVTVDEPHWNRLTAALEAQRDVPEGVLRRARDVAKRAAALDTGAIEGLYEVDRGFTYSVAVEAASWEVALAGKGERVRSLFEAQLHAYDYVLDLATKAEPISEAAVRALHQEVCRAQETYHVVTAVGPQEQPLPKGQYKALPNHVRTRRGTDHSYAPVDMTPPEMARLVGEFRTEAFLSAHPVIQASYAHYALVVIHPFADGNGRVARALASAFTYRAISMPIVILSEQKNSYLDALEAADAGNYQAFAGFMFMRCLDTMGLVNDSILSANIPPLDDTLEGFATLYQTKGGYTQEQVDKAGVALVNAVLQELTDALKKAETLKLTIQVGISNQPYSPSDPNYRGLLGNFQTIFLILTSPVPARAEIGKYYELWLPKNAAAADDVRLRNKETGQAFSARMDELWPAVLGPARMRITMFVGRIVGEALSQLKERAQTALRSAGY